jgi:hypothetical protein
MSSSAGGWFVIVLALICANLPFVNQRLFAGGGAEMAPQAAVAAPRLNSSLVRGGRHGRLRGGSEPWQRVPQGWQFYAITACMMLVFAFPGFTWQYLVKHRTA